MVEVDFGFPPKGPKIPTKRSLVVKSFDNHRFPLSHLHQSLFSRLYLSHIDTMMLRVLSLCLLVASTSAFMTAPSSGRVTRSSHVSMFEDGSSKFGKPLQTMDEPVVEPAVGSVEEAAADPTTSLETATTSTQVYKDMNTGEVKEVAWKDPYMSANTDASGLGFAYIFIAGPAFLLLNDVLHFVPPNSPISWLTHY